MKNGYTNGQKTVKNDNILFYKNKISLTRIVGEPFLAMKNKIIISDYAELLSLHKALMEAKFHVDPENLYIAGSPLIANICSRVVKALIEIEAQKDPSKRESWEKWLNLQNHNWIWSRTIQYARNNPEWKSFNNNEKEDYVKCLLSPFKFTKNDIQRFIEEVG